MIIRNLAILLFVSHSFASALGSLVSFGIKHDLAFGTASVLAPPRWTLSLRPLKQAFEAYPYDVFANRISGKKHVMTIWVTNQNRTALFKSSRNVNLCINGLHSREEVDKNGIHYQIKLPENSRYKFVFADIASQMPDEVLRAKAMVHSIRAKDGVRECR